MKNQITITLTSCGRWDLLERTIKSLVQFWDGPPPAAFFICEDSQKWNQGDATKLMASIMAEFPKDWKINGRFFSGKVGQIKAIDLMYAQVQTPYIFHCEDDWEFTKSGFIQKSLSILEEKPSIMQVWLRNPNDRNGHKCTGAPQMTNDRTKYQMLSAEHMNVWGGFSLNPGLRRFSDYQKLFPNGYSGVTTFDPKNPLKSEIEIGQIYKKSGFRAATLLQGFTRHIGNGRHVNG